MTDYSQLPECLQPSIAVGWLSRQPGLASHARSCYRLYSISRSELSRSFWYSNYQTYEEGVVSLEGPRYSGKREASLDVRRGPSA